MNALRYQGHTDIYRRGTLYPFNIYDNHDLSLHKLCGWDYICVLDFICEVCYKSFALLL